MVYSDPSSVVVLLFRDVTKRGEYEDGNGEEEQQQTPARCRPPVACTPGPDTCIFVIS